MKSSCWGNEPSVTLWLRSSSIHTIPLACRQQRWKVVKKHGMLSSMLWSRWEIVYKIIYQVQCHSFTCTTRTISPLVWDWRRVSWCTYNILHGDNFSAITEWEHCWEDWESGHQFLEKEELKGADAVVLQRCAEKSVIVSRYKTRRESHYQPPSSQTRALLRVGRKVRLCVISRAVVLDLVLLPIIALGWVSEWVPATHNTTKIRPRQLFICVWNKWEELHVGWLTDEPRWIVSAAAQRECSWAGAHRSTPRARLSFSPRTVNQIENNIMIYKNIPHNNECLRWYSQVMCCAVAERWALGVCLV